MTTSIPLLAILGKSPVLPAPFLRAAYATACRHDDREVLRALIAREDAPSDLVEVFASLQDPSLEGIYLARTNRAPAAAGRKPERRAAVLARALTKDDVPEDVWQDACDAMHAKPTATLANALARHPQRLTPEAARTVLETLDKLVETRWHQFEPVVPALGARQAGELLAGGHLTSLPILLKVLQFRLPLEVTIAGLRHVVRCADAALNRPQSHDTRIAHDAVERLVAAVLSLWDNNDRDTIAEEVVPELVEHPHVFSAFGRLVSREQRHATFRGTPLEWPASDSSPDTADLPVRTLVAMAAGQSKDELGQVVEAVVSRNSSDVAEVACTILRNPALRQADRHRMLRALADITVSSAVHSIIKEGGLDPIALFPGDPVAVAAWSELFPATSLARHGWDAHGGREMVTYTLTRASDARSGYGEGREEILTAAVLIGLTEEELLDLPWRVVEELCTLPTPSAGRVTDQVATLLTRALGSDGDAWLALSQIADDFPGSFGDLRTSCTAIAA